MSAKNHYSNTVAKAVSSCGGPVSGLCPDSLGVCLRKKFNYRNQGVNGDEKVEALHALLRSLALKEGVIYQMTPLPESVSLLETFD